MKKLYAVEMEFLDGAKAIRYCTKKEYQKIIQKNLFDPDLVISVKVMRDQLPKQKTSVAGACLLKLNDIPARAVGFKTQNSNI